MDDRPILAPLRPVATDDLIRVGSAHDGGYVINRRGLTATRVLVGMGISTNWQFEEMFQELNPRCRVIGIDGSVSPLRIYFKGVRYFAKAAVFALLAQRTRAERAHRKASGFLESSAALPRFFGRDGNVLLQRYIADDESGGRVVWGRGPLADLIGAPEGSAPDVFVKMDIEGAEYGLVASLVADAARICGMAIEFHDCVTRWDELVGAVAQCRAHFYLTHVHANNAARLVKGSPIPPSLELTFLNKALVTEAVAPSTRTYPLAGLDAPNNPARPDHRVVFV